MMADKVRWLTPDESKRAFDLIRETIAILQITVQTSSMRSDLRKDLKSRLEIVEYFYESVFEKRPVYQGLIAAFEKMAEEKKSTVFKEMVSAMEEYVSRYNTTNGKKPATPPHGM